MPKLLKKLSLILLSSLLFANSMIMPFAVAKAQDEAPPSTWYKQDFGTWYSKVYGDESPPSEIFGERYTAAQVEWIFYGIFSFILNHVANQETSAACISGDSEACVSAIKEAIGKIQSLTLIQDDDKSLAQLIFQERDFSGIKYIKDSVSKFSITNQVFAQTTGGFGFSALKPVQQMWGISRNFAYSIAVLVVVIFAFMIMFRVKISPQVVISVQSALPKVIFALVLATFSYAIAGLMVDLMYVVIGILSLFLGQFAGDPTKIYTLMTTGLPVAGGGFLGLMAMYSVLFFWILLFNLFASGNLIVNIVLSPIIVSLFLILIIVIAIILIFMFFKILWLLLKTLAQTFLLVIFAPLQIMFGSVVQGLGFNQWLKSLAGNLAVYPVVGTLFVLSYVFLFFSVKLGLGNLLGSDSLDGLIGTLLGNNGLVVEATWSPPLTLGESYIPLIFVGISFVMLTLIPKTAEIIQGFISGKPFAYGSAIGEAFGPAKSVAGLGTGAAVSYGTHELATRTGVAGTWRETAINQAGAAIGKWASSGFR